MCVGGNAIPRDSVFPSYLIVVHHSETDGEYLSVVVNKFCKLQPMESASRCSREWHPQWKSFKAAWHVRCMRGDLFLPIISDILCVVLKQWANGKLLWSTERTSNGAACTKGTKWRVYNEFLTQFAFNVDIDVSIRELETTKQKLDDTISSFFSRWRAKVANIVDQANKQDQIDIVLRNLQPRFTRHLMGIPFQDFRSLVQANFNVEKGITGGLWIDPTLSPKK
uniref:Retrotransposon gag domain-containing protein n=1 Tax=Vitis vinifera TaxID=29760 RepID=A5C825_VITVI|nr:hypothetical protein VITISV_015067 [Vitis vinifera]